jgi:outer membrane protein OmpA-like peptidoglycan-associated protein
MAGGGSSGEVDYWPGYVDALTAMVKVLTFVMLLLALAIFTLSQKISKNAVERIAEAAGVKVSSTTNIEKMTTEVISAVKAKTSVDSDTKSNEVLAGVAKAAGLPVPEQASTEAIIALLQKSLNESKQQTLASPIAPNLPARATTPSDPAEDRQEAKVEVHDDAKKALGSPASTSGSEVIFTIKFSGNSVLVDEAAGSEIKKFLGGPGRLEMSTFNLGGYANLTTGNVSETRRLAYYRALSVRQFLLAAGVPGDRITVNVRESNQSSYSDIVQISVQ